MRASELSKAIKQNDIDAVKELLENGAEFNSYRTETTADEYYEERIYAISDSIKGRNTEIIELLLTHDTNCCLFTKTQNAPLKLTSTPVPLYSKSSTAGL